MCVPRTAHLIAFKDACRPKYVVQPRCSLSWPSAFRDQFVSVRLDQLYFSLPFHATVVMVARRPQAIKSL